jgi:hypothetical protein
VSPPPLFLFSPTSVVAVVANPDRFNNSRLDLAAVPASVAWTFASLPRFETLALEQFSKMEDPSFNFGVDLPAVRPIVTDEDPPVRSRTGASNGAQIDPVYFSTEGARLSKSKTLSRLMEIRR